jgi:hypothetical protein
MTSSNLPPTLEMEDAEMQQNSPQEQVETIKKDDEFSEVKYWLVKTNITHFIIFLFLGGFL